MSLIPAQNQRMMLHNKLLTLSNVKKVYYQPPMNVKLQYPCVIYQFDNYETTNAANDDYLRFPSYTVTVIDYDVESSIHEELLDMRGDFTIRFDRFFIADGLCHWAFSVIMTKGQIGG